MTDCKIDARQDMAVRLREVRKSYGRNQKDMSRYLGLGEVTWQNYELAKTTPKTETLRMLEDDGYSSAWILTGIGTMRVDNSAVAEDTNTFEKYQRRLKTIYKELKNSNLDMDDGKLFDLSGRIASAMAEGGK